MKKFFCDELAANDETLRGLLAAELRLASHGFVYCAGKEMCTRTESLIGSMSPPSLFIPKEIQNMPTFHDWAQELQNLFSEIEIANVHHNVSSTGPVTFWDCVVSRTGLIIYQIGKAANVFCEANKIGKWKTFCEEYQKREKFYTGFLIGMI
eukprot:Trichotokara_eunicae@DN4363_c0_g1_i2.p1